MSRSATRSTILRALALLAATALTACSSPPVEQQVLTTFFRAARVRDNTTLAGISAVAFDPRTDGAVQQFKINTIGAQAHRALQLQQLAADEAAARSQQAVFSGKMRDFYEANVSAIDRVVKAHAATPALKGKDAELYDTWMKWDRESHDYERKVSQAKQKQSAERAIAVASLTPPGRDDVDVTGMQVDIISEPVTVTAQLQSPAGQITPTTLVLTLQRASGRKAEQTIDGRWIVMSVQAAASGS